uniref:Uncharacterized protein n=1 Tax=Romanomermis culicivorax TaxID=13658 RepID=A0A915KED6_ROMCU
MFHYLIVRNGSNAELWCKREFNDAYIIELCPSDLWANATLVDDSYKFYMIRSTQFKTNPGVVSSLGSGSSVGSGSGLGCGWGLGSASGSGSCSSSGL